MKILYITYLSLTEPLSYSQILAYLKGLARKGVSISVLSFEKRRFATKGNIERVKLDLHRAGIRWFSLRYHKSPQFIAKPWDMLCGIAASFFIVLKEQTGIIHARNTICAFIGILPVILLKKRFVFDIRGFMAEEYLDGGLWRKRSFVYGFVKRLERYFIKLADKKIVITQKAKEFLEKNYNTENSVVIPTCVDLKRFDMKKRAKEKFTLIYTGSLGTWYMLPEMIDFFNALLEIRQGSVFLILSQTEKFIIEKSIPPGLAGNIIIKSAEPQNVADFLSAADAGIFFIKPCLSKISSCPTKFAEYLACGVPVVINSGIGDTAEIVKENRVGVVIEDFNKEGYRSGIQKLMRLIEEGEALKKRCRETAGKYFSLDEGIERYFNVYSDLMK